MAYESNLPANSERFSQTLWKDENNRIWTGKTGEYYRFVDRSEVDFTYVNIRDFGAAGDGTTDDTTAFNAALAEAKATNNFLFFPDGSFPVDFAVDTIDMNGCLGLIGTGTLILNESGTTDVGKPVLEWEGTKVLVSGSVSGSFNQRDFTINTGLDIVKGDTLFLACSDPFYPDSDQGYFKGFRFTVEQYNPVTGAVAMYEYLPYSFSQGWFYWNQYRPKVELSGVDIIMNTQEYKRGINISAGIVYANGVSINGSSRSLMISSSLGRVTNCRICVNHNIPTQTGYGVQSAGLSDVYIEGSNIYGYRHAVACGDWGWWRTDDVFEAPGDDANMPSICRISGCRLSGTGNTYAIDSHGGTLLLDIFNCDVYGGVQFGGWENYISDSRIYQSPVINQCLRFGRDRTVASGNFLSKYAVKNCIVFCKREFFWIQPDIESVELINIDIRVQSDTVPRNMIRYHLDQPRIKNLTVKDVRITSPVGEVVDFLFKANSSTIIDGIISDNASITVKAEDVGSANLSVNNVSVRGNVSGHGVKIVASGSSDKSTTLVASGIKTIENLVGLVLEGIKSANISSAALNGNTSSSVQIIESATAGKVRVVVANSILAQASGAVIDGTTEDVDLYQIGNIYEQSSVVANINQVARYGGYGFNDKLKTVKTVATAAKYGAEAGTGDLTLS